MGLTVDFSEFNKLRRIYKNLENDFNAFLYLFLHEMAERVLALTKEKTPVDTGALKAAWEIGDVHGNGSDMYIEIRNPMEYATDIEYGHRIVRGSGADKIEVGWYDGRFMLKTGIEHVRKQMPLRFERQFKAFCTRHGLATE